MAQCTITMFRLIDGRVAALRRRRARSDATRTSEIESALRSAGFGEISVL